MGIFVPYRGQAAGKFVQNGPYSAFALIDAMVSVRSAILFFTANVYIICQPVAQVRYWWYNRLHNPSTRQLY